MNQEEEIKVNKIFKEELLYPENEERDKDYSCGGEASSQKSAL